MILAVCKCCGHIKRAKEFYARRNGRRFSECIECTKAKQNARYVPHSHAPKPSSYSSRPIVLIALQKWCVRHD